MTAVSEWETTSPILRWENRLGKVKSSAHHKKGMNWISSSGPLHTSRSIHGFLITAQPESLDAPIIAKDTASPWHIQAVGHVYRICRHESGAGWGWAYSLSIAAVTSHCKLSTLRTTKMYSLTVLEARSLKALCACMLSCFCCCC